MTEPVATIAAIPTNNNSDTTTTATIARLTAQLKKLNEANGKYKQLLKLAKERIQKQEIDLQEQQQANVNSNRINNNATTTTSTSTTPETTRQVVAVCQRIRHADQIWALLEWEIVPENEQEVFLSFNNNHARVLEWKSFPNDESALHDFIRRDTGEPLPVPPYSYSPEQSVALQQETQAQVQAVTEEFRKFRIQTELQQQQRVTSEARRNTKAPVTRSAAHNNNINTLPLQHNSTQQQQQQQQQLIEQLQAELQLQDTRWKQAYDLLLAENKALQSTGSEALVASQWRQRYEACVAEKEELHSRLQNLQTEDHYEAKYRDLKESFKLYRKKAKEILEQQQQQHGSTSNPLTSSTTNNSSDAKLSYLKNLLFQYFMADDESTRAPMQGAIGMVVEFSPSEVQQIIEAKRRAEKDSSWF